MAVKPGLLLTAVAAVLLCLHPAVSEQSPSKPMRIVSLTLVTDEIAAALVEPGRIAAMSRFASDERTSNVAAIANRIGRFVDRDVEQIVGLNPDVVLSARYSKLDVKEVLPAIGIAYHELTRFETIQDIEANIRSIAGALGETSRGEETIRDMRRKLETAGREFPAERRAWRALYLAAGEWTAGAKTTFDEIVRHAGLKNAAAESGISGHVRISPETIISIDPEVIVVGTGYSRDADYSAHLAKDSRFVTLQSVRMKRIVAVPSRHLLTTSQFIGDAAVDISRRVRALAR